jgi:hypothetical protein
LRADGGSIAWRAQDADEVRATDGVVAYGAFDCTTWDQGPNDDRSVVAPSSGKALELHGLVARQEIIVKHLDAARDLANRPPNDLTPVALAAHAKSHGYAHLTVESHGRDWIETHEMGAFAAVASGSARPQLIVMRYEPPEARRRDARPRRQGDHLRLGRHLAQDRATDAGNEGRHVRWRGRDRGDGRDRRARPSRAAATVVPSTRTSRTARRTSPATSCARRTARRSRSSTPTPKDA